MRFSNALEQYQHLQDIIKAEVNAIVDAVRVERLSIPEKVVAPTPNNPPIKPIELGGTADSSAITNPLPPAPLLAPSVHGTLSYELWDEMPSVSIEPEPAPSSARATPETVNRLEGDRGSRPLRELDTNSPASQRKYVNARTSNSNEPEQKAGEDNQRPSAYLRRACPICFGPNVRQQTPDGMYVHPLHPPYASP